MAYQSNPIFEVLTDSDKITCRAVGAVTGKTLVKIVPGGTDRVPNVSTAGAGDVAYGIAGWDKEDGGKVTIYRRGVLTVTAGAALTAGARVEPGANGRVVAATTGTPVGSVHADAASGTDAAVAVNF